MCHTTWLKIHSAIATVTRLLLLTCGPLVAVCGLFSCSVSKVLYVYVPKYESGGVFWFRCALFLKQRKFLRFQKRGGRYT